MYVRVLVGSGAAGLFAAGLGLWSACASPPYFSLAADAAPAAFDDAEAPGPKLRVFVTVGKMPPSFGLGAPNGPGPVADRVCTEAAAKLGGTGRWSAFLWRSAINPPVTMISAPGNGWYQVLADGGTGAVAVPSLRAANLTAPILTQSGTQLLDEGLVWTGGGVEPFRANCNDWNGSDGDTHGGVGQVASTDGKWLWRENVSCAGAAHLYCFEQQP